MSTPWLEYPRDWREGTREERIEGREVGACSPLAASPRGHRSLSEPLSWMVTPSCRTAISLLSVPPLVLQAQGWQWLPATTSCIVLHKPWSFPYTLPAPS